MAKVSYENQIPYHFAVLLCPLLILAQNSNTIVNPRSAINSAANAAANAVSKYYVQPTPEKPKTKIIGRVIYEDTGKPVRRGEISLLK